MSMRVHQLAKALGITSNDLIDKLHSLKIDVKGHMSVIEDDVALSVKAALKPKKEKLKAKEKAPKKIKEPLKAKEPKVEAKKAEPVKVEAPKVQEKKVEPKIEEIKAEVKIEEIKEEPKPEPKVLKINFPIIVKDLAIRLEVKPSELLKKLLDKKVLVTINQALSEEVASLI